MHAIPLAGPTDHDGGWRAPPHALTSVSPGATAGSRAAADAVLAAALLTRAPTAARQAWIQLSPVVRAVLRRELGLGPDEMDLCQEVFLRFFRRIHELRDPGALRGFVVGIALGVARNQRRRARIRRCVSLTATGDPPEVAGIGPDFEARQILSRLHQVLIEADADDRSLFLTRYVHHEHLDTIAALSGCGVGAVKGRLARALHRLGNRMRRDAVLAPQVSALGVAASVRSRSNASPSRERNEQ